MTQWIESTRNTNTNIKEATMTFNPNFGMGGGASFPLVPQYPQFGRKHAGATSPVATMPQFPVFGGYNGTGRGAQLPQFPQYPQVQDPYSASFQRSLHNQMYYNTFNKRKKQNPYTDPYAINSLSDALFNNTAKTQKYGEANWLYNTTKAVVGYANEQYIQPALEGRFKDVGVNAMTALNEDFAIFKNPMKGAIIEAGSEQMSGIVGITSAILGGVAVAASGPVGWGAVLSGALAAGGAAAVGTAFVEDPTNAMLGFKRGFGVDNELKQAYDFVNEDGERMGFFSNLIVNMALDPAMWVTGAGSLLESKVSDGMKSLLGTSARLSPGKSVPMAELLKASNTLMDTAFTGTQAVLQANRAIAKTAMYLNPIGLTWNAAKYGGRAIQAQVSKFVQMHNTIEGGYPVGAQLKNVVDAKSFTDQSFDGRITQERFRLASVEYGKMNSEVIVNGKSMTVENYMKGLKSGLFSKETAMVQPGTNRLQEIVAAADAAPEDLSLLHRFTMSRFSMFNKGGVATDQSVAAVHAEIKGIFRSGFVPEGVDPSMANTLLERYGDFVSGLDDGMLDIFIEEITRPNAFLNMTNQTIVQASEALLNKTFKALPRNATKMDVLAITEREFTRVMGVAEGSGFADVLMLMGQGDTDLSEIYEPIFDTLLSIYAKFGIDQHQLMSYIARDTSALPRLLGEAYTESVTPNSFASKALNKIIPEGPGLAEVKRNMSPYEQYRDYMDVYEEGYNYNLKGVQGIYANKEPSRTLEFGYATDGLTTYGTEGHWADGNDPLNIPNKISKFHDATKYLTGVAPIDHFTEDGITYGSTGFWDVVDRVSEGFVKPSEITSHRRLFKPYANSKYYYYNANRDAPDFAAFGEDESIVPIQDYAAKKGISFESAASKAGYYKNRSSKGMIFDVDPNKPLPDEAWKSIQNALHNDKRVIIKFGDDLSLNFSREHPLYEKLSHLRYYEENIEEWFEESEKAVKSARAQEIGKQAKFGFKDFNVDDAIVANVLAPLWGLDIPTSPGEMAETMEMINHYILAGIETNPIQIGDRDLADDQFNMSGREMLRNFNLLPKELRELIAPLMKVEEQVDVFYGDEAYMEAVFDGTYDESDDVAYDFYNNDYLNEDFNQDSDNLEIYTSDFREQVRPATAEVNPPFQYLLDKLAEQGMSDAQIAQVAMEMFPVKMSDKLELSRKISRSVVNNPEALEKLVRDTFGGDLVTKDEVIKQLSIQTLTHMPANDSASTLRQVNTLREIHEKLIPFTPNMPNEMVNIQEAQNSLDAVVKFRTTQDFVMRRAKFASIDFGLDFPKGITDTDDVYAIFSKYYDDMVALASSPVDLDKELLRRLLGDIQTVENYLDQLDDAPRIMEGFIKGMNQLKAIQNRMKVRMTSKKNLAYRTDPVYRDAANQLRDLEITMESLIGKEYGGMDEFFHKAVTRRQFYTPQFNKRTQYSLLVDEVLTEHKHLMDDLFVSKGPAYRVYNRIMSLDMGDTSLVAVKDANREFYNRSFGAVKYGDLSSAVTRYINNFQLDEKYYNVTMDALTMFDSMDPKELAQQFRTPGTPAYRKMENNLGMSGLNTNLAHPFSKMIAEYLDALAEQGIPKAVYLPGSGFNQDVNEMMGLNREFLKDLEEFDDYFTTRVDLLAMADGVYETVTDISEIQKAAQDYVVANAQDRNVTKFHIDQDILGLRDVSGNTDTYKSIYRDFTPVDMLKLKAGAALNRSLSTYIGTPDNFRMVYTSPEAKLGAYKEIREEFLAATETQEFPTDIKTTQDKLKARQAAVKRSAYTRADTETGLQIIDFIDEVQELSVSDSLFAKQGLDITLYQRAEILKNMPAESIATELKFNSTAGFQILQKSLFDDGFSVEQLQDLAEYGIIVADVPNTGFKILRKVADTPAYEALKPAESVYTLRGTKDSIVGNSSAREMIEKTDAHVRSRLNVTSVFASDLHPPIKLNTDAILNIGSMNPELIEAVGGIDAWEEFAKAHYRSRGFQLDVLADYETMKQFVGYDNKSGLSYLPYDIVRTYYNALESMLNHNDAEAHVYNYIKSDFNSFEKTFRDHSNANIVEIFKTNPSLHAVYFTDKGKVRKFNVTNTKQAAKARELDLVLVDRATYDMMFRVMNKKKAHESGGIVKFVAGFHKVLSSVHIASSMSSVAMSVRNFADTVLKNTIVTGDFINPMKYIDSLEDFKWLEKVAKDLGGDLNTPTKIDKYFEINYPNENERIDALTKFNYLVRVTSSPGFSGLPEAVQDRLFRGLDENGNPIPEGPLDNGLIRFLAFGNPITKNTLKVYSAVETTSRLTLINHLVEDKGMDLDTALAIMEDTHFNYNTRSEGEMLLNTIMPFSTFPMRNFLLWLEIFFDNPVLVTALYNAIVDSWIQDDYSASKIADEEDNFQKYQFLTGNVQEKRNMYTTILKLNPSMFDAMTYAPTMALDPLAKLSGPIKNMNEAIKYFSGEPESVMNEDGTERSLIDNMEIPFSQVANRAAKILMETHPTVVAGLNGQDEDWRFIPEYIPSLFSVSKYKPEEFGRANGKFVSQYPKYRPRTPRVPYSRPAYYRGPRKARHPFPQYGAPQQYFAKGKGNRALSTGMVTKKGRFRATGGIGYGNPQHLRNSDMRIEFGKYGAYLQNAPHGVGLRRLNYQQRTLYGKHYSKAGNSRLKNRIKPINDPKSLAFRIQDMHYNLF